MRATTQAAVSTGDARTTRILLGCGLMAGPLFILASVVQGLIRAGFDLTRQPLSFLGLGDLGWLQQTNFILSGLLLAGLAAGVLRALSRSAAGIFGPPFILVMSAGLIIAGLYPPDPGFGYPIGTPDGVPVHITQRSVMHGVGFILSFGGFALSCLVFAARDIRRGQRLGAAYTLLSATVALILGMWPGVAAIALRDFAAATLLWIWVAVQARRIMSGD